MFETFSFVVLWITVGKEQCKLADFYVVLNNLYSTTFKFLSVYHPQTSREGVGNQNNKIKFFQIVQCDFE
jgi:hypothetical protein